MPLRGFIAFGNIMRERCPFQLSWFALRRGGALCLEKISPAGRLTQISNNAFGLFSLPSPSEKCYSGPGFSLWYWIGVLRAPRLRRLPVWACWSSQLSPRAVSAQTPPTAPLPYKDKGERERMCDKVMKKSEAGTGRLKTEYENVFAYYYYYESSQCRRLDVMFIKRIPSVYHVIRNDTIM